MQRIVLPDGLAVWAPSAVEAAVVYREVVTDGTYFSHGVTLEANAVVLDVGANVGLFALYSARAMPGVRVHAFEPVTELFGALQRNVAEHAPHVHVYNVGIADREGEAILEIDKFMTIGATMHPQVFRLEEGATVATWLAAALRDMATVKPHRVLRLLSARLASPLWRPVVVAALVPVVIALGVRKWLYLKRERCRLTTLSRAIASTGEAHIDLLKIDVEGAEEQVVAGIGDSDWPRIRQLVIEVHDIDGRLERLTQKLERLGYRTIHAREDWKLHELLRISTLYAIRNVA